jgi:hypothetical protein
MNKCAECNEEVLLPYRCSYCQNYFCLQHRLPESHNCPNLPIRGPLGSSQVRREIAQAKAEEGQKVSINEGKRELPIFRFHKNSKKKTRMQYPKRKQKR